MTAHEFAERQLILLFNYESAMQRRNGTAANHLTVRRRAPRFGHMTRKGRFVSRNGLFDTWPNEPVGLPRRSKSARTIASKAGQPQPGITVVSDGLYDQNGQAVPTFADVTTPGAAEVDDVQQIVTAPGGTFSLSYNGNATAAQNAGEPAATLQTALQAVPGLAQVTVTGAGTAASPYLVTFGGDLKGENVPPLTAVGATLNSIATSYDNAGQITAVGDNYSHYAYTYDGQGNTASVDNAGSPDSPRVVLASQYDAAGNRESLAATLYNGGTAEPDFINNYSYDALSRLTVMQQQQQNQPGANAVAAKEIDYAYNGLGEVTSRADFNFIGVGPRQDMATGTFTYDSTTGLLTSLNYTSHGGATAIDNFNWTYDTLARVKTFSSFDGTATYGYDSRSEVTSAGYTTNAGGHQPANESFSFDANGNRPVANGGTIVNNEVSDDGTFKYTFDADGNRLTRTRDSAAAANDYQVSYSYDYRNRLVEVRDFNNSGTLTEQIDYTYDVFDHLIQRVDDVIGGATTATQYIWDGDSIALSFVNGALAARYLNGPNTKATDRYFTTLAEEHVTSLVSPGTLTFDLPDNEGTLRDIADANGNPADHLVYTVFGQLAYESAPTVAHIDGYAGGLYDPSTQLVYFIHRWYDPAATVWISADPMGFAAADTNLMRYVGNDPTDYIDSAGFAKQKPVNGNTPAAQNGKIAHKGFPAKVGGQGEVPLAGGRADCVKETPSAIRVRELKPKGRVMKNGTLSGTKYNQAVRQVERYAAAVPNPNGKTIYCEIWGYVRNACTKRTRYIKLKGWKYVGKAIPGAGTVIAAVSYGSDVQTKGIAGGTANTALDACPLVGTGKFFFEIVMGEDIVPDKSEGLPWYSRVYSPIQAIGRGVTNLVTRIHLSGPLFVDSRNK